MAKKPVAGPSSGHLTKAYGAMKQGGPLEPLLINRRNLDAHDIEVKIKFCGICHSEVHLIRNDWGNSHYPMVPGHEIVGVVTQVGSDVTKFKKGDFVGITCMYDSCRHCAKCKRGEEQYCDEGMVISFNSPYVKDDGALTCGGFSEKTVVDENYAIKISDSNHLDKIAPLLCAGITVYSPLKYLHTNENSRVAVVGFGGLGHLAVKIAKAMKAEVSVISRSLNKEAAALKLGIKHFIVSTDKKQMKEFEQKFDIILDTASGKHDLNGLLQLLDVDGKLVMLGAPAEPFDINMIPVTLKRRTILGSGIAGVKESQETIDFCHEHGIFSDVEVIPISKVNEALETLAKGEIAHRLVIDMTTL